ncbi:hypothetical protein BHM03_00028752, partial [Ensete ventricosum]
MYPAQFSTIWGYRLVACVKYCSSRITLNLCRRDVRLPDIQIIPMDIINSEIHKHTKDNGPLQTEIPTSAYKTHSYLQANIGHKANQTRAAKSTASPLLAIQVRELGYSTSPILLGVEKTSIAYCLLRSLVEHSYINPKSLAFGYLDEKPIDTGLMKFLGLCISALSWYLEFAFAFSTSSAPFTTNALPP